MRGIRKEEFEDLTGQKIDQFLPEDFNPDQDELEISVERKLMDQLLDRYSYESRTGNESGHEFTLSRYFAIINTGDVCEAENSSPLGEAWGGKYLGLDSIRFVVEYHRHFAEWPKRDIESDRTLTVYVVDHDDAERLSALRDLCLVAMNEAHYNQVLRIATILNVNIPDANVTRRRF